MEHDIEAKFRELELDALHAYKSGKAAPPTVWRDSGYLKAHGEGDKLPVFVASEESEDRMGDIIEAAGWKIDNFQKNPVFMLAHSYDQLPIGTVPAVGVDGKQLLASVKFDTDDPIGASVAGKYQRGVMRAVSVGFRALEFEEMEGKSGSARRPGIRFKSAELLEISAVAVPAHPLALAQRSVAYRFYSFGPSVTTTETVTTTGVTIAVKAEPKPEPQVAIPDQLTPADVERLLDAMRQIKA